MNDTDDLHTAVPAAMHRIPKGPTPYMVACSSASTARPLQMSAAQMLVQTKNLLADLPPEPIGEWMRERGFPPETSTLVLHDQQRLDFPAVLPPYVKFSQFCKPGSATLVRSTSVGDPL